jgi:hypothetical protein
MDRLDDSIEGAEGARRHASARRATVVTVWLRAARAAALLAAVVLAFGWPEVGAGTARASVVQALSIEQLTSKADEILIAVPTEQRARRHEGGKLIVTDVSLRVESVLKGKSKVGKTARATVLGGTLDGVALQVPGEASFAIGRRVLVFLHRAQSSQDLRVVGMSQGVLALRDQDGTTMVMPGGQDAALVDRGASGTLEEAPAALQRPEPLTALVERIRALVAAGR